MLAFPETAELERVQALVGKRKPVFLDRKTWEIDYRFAIPFEEIRWQEHAPGSDEPQAPNSPGRGVNTRRLSEGPEKR